MFQCHYPNERTEAILVIFSVVLMLVLYIVYIAESVALLHRRAQRNRCTGRGQGRDDDLYWRYLLH